ncbi:MAG: hypothetical protein D6748_16005, partial [Calditrichaeota bacterium]
MKRWKLLSKYDLEIIIIDLIMMGLLIVNLCLIVFDWLFMSVTIQSVFARYTPDFYQFYLENIHKDFLKVDLYFVSIFLLEFLIRWGIAVYRKTYYRWFFYPFIHWYDLLGCIPVGSLRFLRILRVVSIIIRLHKLQIIDITKTYLYSKVLKYYNILVEEISDRVVVNILEGVQDEIRFGNPVTNRILTEVITPQKEVLVDWISHRVQKISQETHQTYRKDIQKYIEKRIARAVEKNREIGTISQIPLFGPIIADNLENAISDIVFNVINDIIEDLATANSRIIVSDITDIALDSLLAEDDQYQLDEITRNIFLQSLEVIKDQVKVK